MRSWRSRLDRWMQVWGRLSELAQDCFPVRPTAGERPTSFPACPALIDFYARCDGGTFGAYTFVPAAEVTDAAAGWLADAPGLDAAPGRWLHLGGHEYGHALLWDGAQDEVVLYSADDETPRRSGRTMDQFLGRLFYPSSKASAEATQLWAEALTEADRIAEQIAAADRPRE